MAAEILKSQINQGRRKELYHFRDQQGLEVDFLFPDGRGSLWMAECKVSRTVVPAMAGPLASLRRSMADQLPVRQSLVHRASPTAPRSRAISPGVEALDIATFVKVLGGAPKRSARTNPSVLSQKYANKSGRHS